MIHFISIKWRASIGNRFWRGKKFCYHNMAQGEKEMRSKTEEKQHNDRRLQLSVARKSVNPRMMSGRICLSPGHSNPESSRFQAACPPSLSRTSARHHPGIDRSSCQVRTVTVRQKSGAVLAPPVPACRLCRYCLNRHGPLRGTQHV